VWTREPRRSVARACRRAARCPARGRGSTEPSIDERKKRKSPPSHVPSQANLTTHLARPNHDSFRRLFSRIPPEIDLCRPVKSEKSARSKLAFGDIFTGKISEFEILTDCDRRSNRRSTRCVTMQTEANEKTGGVSQGKANPERDRWRESSSPVFRVSSVGDATTPPHLRLRCIGSLLTRKR